MYLELLSVQMAILFDTIGLEPGFFVSIFQVLISLLTSPRDDPPPVVASAPGGHRADPPRPQQPLEHGPELGHVAVAAGPQVEEREGLELGVGGPGEK